MQTKRARLVAALMASLAVVTLLPQAVFAVTVSDVLHLNNALLAKTTPIAADDYNADGTVNAVDLTLMKRALRTAGQTLTEQDVSATESFVKLTGRTARLDDITWLVQSGSAVECVVTGQSAEVELAGDSGIDSGADYRPRYAVFVDDVLVTDALLDTKTKTIPLFTGTQERSATVKVMLLSEAMNGAVGVANLHVSSAALIPVKPVPKRALSIEFIGDSITCAYGVEGRSNSEPFKTSTENFTKSYAYLTAQKLQADYSAVCYSGHGIISGYTSSGDINPDSLIPDCYGLISKLSDYAKPWTFSSDEQDVVVINLGTNDSGYVTKAPDTRSQEFVDGYVQFLQTVREKRPNAYIICTLGTMGYEDVYLLVADAVKAFQEKTGDTRVMSYQSTVQNAADGYGSDWHPSAVTQQNSAYVLADRICQALGMESDQIGLDVAADVTYEVVIDPDLGGNAASYVGYDKSFWINMVTGGTAANAIEAQLSGIGLKKGGEYRLEFDYTSTVAVSIPVLVKGTTLHFSGSIDAGAEKQHFTETFTVQSNDTANLLFQLGGTDYYNATFSNIKLWKIG